MTYCTRTRPDSIKNLSFQLPVIFEICRSKDHRILPSDFRIGQIFNLSPRYLDGISNPGSWDHGTAEPSMTQKHICSWSLKLIFCSFEVLTSTSKLQNMKSKLQLEILFWWYALDKNVRFHVPPQTASKKTCLYSRGGVIARARRRRSP